MTSQGATIQGESEATEQVCPGVSQEVEQQEEASWPTLPRLCTMLSQKL